jgi:hypothetical protein
MNETEKKEHRERTNFIFDLTERAVKLWFCEVLCMDRDEFDYIPENSRPTFIRKYKKPKKRKTLESNIEQNIYRSLSKEEKNKVYEVDIDTVPYDYGICEIAEFLEDERIREAIGSYNYSVQVVFNSVVASMKDKLCTYKLALDKQNNTFYLVYLDLLTQGNIELTKKITEIDEKYESFDESKKIEKDEEKNVYFRELIKIEEEREKEFIEQKERHINHMLRRSPRLGIKIRQVVSS